jgi:hypothetical protein
MKSAELLAQPATGTAHWYWVAAPICRRPTPKPGRAALERLVHDWLNPLVAAVHAGALADLTLLSDTGASFCYRRRHRWYFWRRPRPLATSRAT